MSNEKFWDIQLGNGTRCVDGDDLVILCLTDGYIEYLSYPLICKHSTSIEEFISALNEIAKHVKDKDVFLSLTKRLIDYIHSNDAET
jgi:hypothetical protein